MPAEKSTVTTQTVLRADHVGSLLRPRELLDTMRASEQGECSDSKLAEVQDRCIRDVIRLQESIGLQSITDGEYRRRSWIRGFMAALGGFSIKPGKIFFKNEDGTIRNPMPAPYLSRKLKRTKPIVANDYRFISAHTTKRAKVTLPTPSVFHAGLLDESFDKSVYPDAASFFEDMIAVYHEEIAELGKLGCSFLQLDETQFPMLCDPQNREIFRQNGHDPDRLIDTYIEINNRLISDRPDSMTVGMHLCRGNASGLFMAAGGYEPVAERLFNNQNVDVYFLEYDSPRAGDFTPLRFVPKGRIVVLGLVSTKNPEIESEDTLRRRIDEASKYIPVEQLALSPQCGFASSDSSWNVTQNPMTLDVQKRKLALIVDVADKVWS